MNTTTPTPQPPASRPVIRLLAGAVVSLAAVAGLAGVGAPAARADEPVIADTASPGAVIAQTGSPRPAAAPAAAGPRALASLPGGIVVSGHAGAPIALFAQGQPPLRRTRPGTAPVTFAHLVPGRAYTVIVGRRSLGEVIALDRPAPVGRIVVTAPGAPGTARVAWTYRGSRATGGHAVHFDVTAYSGTAATVRTTVGDVRSAVLTRLDPSAFYTFTVTPSNSAGAGRATSATMTRPLGSPAATGPAPVTPSPAPAPAVLTCPSGYDANDTGSCTRTLPYTYSSIPYTFHRAVVGTAPLLESQETTATNCPVGWYFEDYGWIRYCRVYGPAPTALVKDATPDGYSDSGTAWVRRDPAPDGFVDAGTGWIRTVPKVAATSAR